MIYKKQNTSRPAGRYHRACGWRFGLFSLCLAAATLISQPAWAIRVYLRSTDGSNLSGTEWRNTDGGTWHDSGESADLGDDRVIEFVYRGKDVYWTVNASNNQWGMPHETLVVNPHQDYSTNFYFFKYSNTLSVVTEGVLTHTNAIWSFLGPSALLTNSSAYQARYTNTHYGDGSPVETILHPMPTGTVRITFGDIVGYAKPPNVVLVVSGANPQTVTGVYARQIGDIRIFPQFEGSALTNATWSITEYPDDYPAGTPGYPLSGAGEMIIPNVPVGNYTVQFNSDAFYGDPTPPVVSKVNVQDATTDYIAVYKFTGKKLTVHVVLPSETNGNWLVGAGAVQLVPPGSSTTNAPEVFYYPADTDVTLTAIPSNVVVDGVAYKSYFFEWTGRRWNGVTWVDNELGGHGSPCRINPISLKMDNDRMVTVLFSREKYPWDNVGDLDGDGLPDEWEIMMGLSPKDSAAIHGAYGNPDGDWIPSVETNPPTLVSIIDDSNSPDGEMAGGVYWVSYDGIAGAVPGYPLRRTRMLKPQTLGVGSMMGYAGGPAFHNLLECRGFDGFYKTNGGHWTSATTFDAYWTPDDDPGTDPLLADTDNDQMTDGWEYYFWYWRSADAAARGLTASANLDWVMLHPNFANAGDWDTDGDGLTDFQEYMLGTDPTHADTDGDSMDDWWECQYDNLNPLDYSDSVDNSDADYMAVRRNLCVLEMTNGITNVVSGTLFTQNVLEGPSGEYWVDVDGDNAFTLYTDIILVGGEALSHGLIGVVVSDVYYGMAPGLPRYLPGYPVWVDTDGDGIYTTEIDIPLINPPIKHELVYMAPPEEFPEGAPGETSFSPLTAWFEGRLVSGYTLGTNQVSVTWNGPWQTERYNAYQEYLGGDYLGRLSWDAGGRVISENDDFLFPDRTAFTNPNNQDTDNDGIPDGWELYVGLDPNYETDASWNHDEPLVDGEKPAFLNNREEWANLSHPLSRELAWDTKIWPTDPGAIIAPPPNDPHPADTDWDGLHDGKEREALTCPTMVDTDRDGLPDGWEVYACVNPRLKDANEDNDHDGLLNWQEYWTGTVAEWQYCDPSWDLMFMSRKMSWWDWDLNGRTNVFLPPDFLTCPSFLYYNGIITDLELLREEFPASKALPMEHYKTTYAGYNLSGDNNPMDSDRDGMDDFWEVFHCLNPLMGFISKMDIGVPDGDTHMPLVGTVDADPSQPGYQVGLPGRPFTNAMDLINYFRDKVRIYEDVKDRERFKAVGRIVGPHCFGCLNNDPDDDGLPNFQEYTHYRNAHIHTCPVPLWRTNPYETNSIYRFIRNNYASEVLKLGEEGRDGFAIFGFGGITYSMTRGSLPFRWAAMTEGFDTDNDMIGDYQEVTGYRTNGMVAATDPLDDQNPMRNRVLHLDGTNSWGRSYAWSHYGDFATFSVEAWARPARLISPNDQVIVEKSSGYTVETTNGIQANSLANFQLGIGADGAPYILFHGISGHTTQRASAASLAGQLRPNEWIHLAGVFDGSKLTLYVNGDAAATHHTTDVPARGLEGNYGIWHPNCNLSVGARELKCGWMFPKEGEKFFQGCIDEVRVWDRVLTQSEIRLRKDRELTPEEVGTILPSNRPYKESVNNLFAYYTFNSLPDPAIDGIVPSEFPLHKRPPLSLNYSQIYTNQYLVIAADRVKRIPRMPSLDTRVIGTNPVATSASPDSHGINTTNYMDDITLPADFRNSANPYNFTHSTYNI
ncbi:MAG: LamG-like jellyroll fold domain-containing protein, partial [Kiritimatiellia bacterium]